MSIETGGFNPEEHSIEHDLRGLMSTAREMLTEMSGSDVDSLLGKVEEKIKTSPDVRKEISNVDTLIASTDGESASVQEALAEYSGWVKKQAKEEPGDEGFDDEEDEKKSTGNADEWGMGSDDEL